MHLPGHTDPTLVKPVYQQVLDTGGAVQEQVERLIGCTADEALDLLSGRDVWTPKGHSPTKGRLSAGERSKRVTEQKPLWDRLRPILAGYAPVAQLDRAAAF